MDSVTAGGMGAGLSKIWGQECRLNPGNGAETSGRRCWVGSPSAGTDALLSGMWATSGSDWTGNPSD